MGAEYLPGFRIGHVHPRLVQESGYMLRLFLVIFTLPDFRTFFIFTITSAWVPLSCADRTFALKTARQHKCTCIIISSLLWTKLEYIDAVSWQEYGHDQFLPSEIFFPTCQSTLQPRVAYWFPDYATLVWFRLVSIMIIPRSVRCYSRFNQKVLPIFPEFPRRD